MALETHTCGKCSTVAQVDVPDDGSGTVWECTDPGCSARNVIDAAHADPEVVVAVSDGDEGLGSAQQSA